MLPDELLDMFVFVLVLGVPYVELDELVVFIVDMLPLVFAGVFMSLFVLLVMLPVPVPPVFEPAFGGVPLMSVVGFMPLVVPLCMVVFDDMPLFVVDVAVVSLLLLFPLSLSRSERQPKVVMTRASRKTIVNFVLLLI